jgi:hypothetical protein
MKKIYSFLYQRSWNVLSILLCLFLLGQSPAAIAQTDTEFWFAVPEIAQSAPQNQYDPYDRPIVLRITGGSQAGTVTISAPANPGFVPKVIPLAANDVVTVDLTSEIVNLETTPSNTALNTGLLISSTVPISAYYEVLANGFSVNAPLNPEIYGLKGRSALGTSFLTPFQNIYDNSDTYQPVALSSFDIVATDNNTTVNITPSQAIDGHPAGVTFSIVLNKGQTYSAKASSANRNAHLGGSKVTSDKCIAITMKDDQLYSGGEYSSSCVDQIGDQLIPISNLNNQYVVLRTRMTLPNPEKVFVLATEDNTQISSNNVPLATLNKGQTFLISITADATEITASKNVYVLQLGGTGCELGSAVLPGLNWNGNPLGETQFGFVRTTNQLFPINVLAPTANIGSFLVNGSATVIKATDFLPVPNVPGWSYARLELDEVGFPQGIEGVVRNTAGVFQIGILNGGQTTGASYGYFSNYKDNGCAPVSKPVLTVTKTDIKCFGSSDGSITLTVSGGTSPYTYTLGGPVPAGIPTTGTFTGPSTTINGFPAGVYSVNLVDANGNAAPSGSATIQTFVTALAASVSSQNAKCATGSTGSITITPSGGTPSYTITSTGIVAPGVTVTAGNSATFNGLAAATYDYTITDANGCSILKSVTILKPNTLVVTATATPNCGSIKLVPTGGTPNYKISGTGIVGQVDLPAAGLIVTGLTGAYSYTITDANSCTGTLTGTISNPCVVGPPCTFGQTTTYYGGFEAATNFSATTAGNDLFLGLPRNGSYQVVSNISQAGGGGYLSTGPHSGTKFMLIHTSSKPTDRLWYSKVAVTPGQTYLFCAWLVNMKANPVNGFVINLTANGNTIATKTTGYGWGQICGTYTVPAGVTSVEFAVKDPFPSVGASHFLGLDDICLSPTSSFVAAPASAINNSSCFASATKSSVKAKTEWVYNSDNTITIRTTLAKTFVDNTYGTTAMGWSKGHKFTDMVSGDMLQLALYDGSNAKKMEFKIDYITASNAAASGYKSLGVTGGDGKMLTGVATDIVGVNTSLDDNLNTNGSTYYSLITNSPATNSAYDVNATYAAWEYEVWYEVRVKVSAFGTKGFGYPSVISLYASPSKTAVETEAVVAGSCSSAITKNSGAAATTVKLTEKKEEPVLVETLTVNTMPNPTRATFTMQLDGKPGTTIRVRILDVSGRLLKTFSELPSNYTLQFGTELKKGSYFAEVIQGEERKIVKLVKM